MSDRCGELVALHLVPVEVFGADGCGDPDCTHCRDNAGYGLSDAVQAWSDCNRAVGRIYRVEDLGDPHGYRIPGEFVTVYVRPEDVSWFERHWGSP